MSLYNSDFGCERVAELLMGKDVRVHLIGALGAGMSPLGTLLRDKGVYVTGYDRNMDKVAMPEGVVKSSLSDLCDVTLAVYSLAISEDDKEITTARERNIPLVSRAELLGAFMLPYERRIGVSGSHGKSTTTAILDHILFCGGKSPTTVSGALLTDGAGFRRGGGSIFLYEACEYKDSFLRTRPTDVIINNIELDHTDYFHSTEELKESFFEFSSMASGFTVIGDDGGIARSIYEDIKERAVLVGSSEDCDFRYTDVEFFDTGARFSLKYKDKYIGSFENSLIGEYNVKNTAVALSMAYLMGVDINKMSKEIKSFRGISRRAELIGYINSRAVYYDYAHHPTEIREFLSAIKLKHGSVSCIFKPHTYSRTAGLWRDFVLSLGIADHSVILGIYPAREEPIEGITSYALAKEIGESAVSLDEDEAIAYCLSRSTGSIALIGAGDVEDVKEELLKLIK